MRDVKFRGYVQGHYTYGFYVTDGDSYHAIISPLNDLEMKNTPVSAESVGQFTGLRDSHGVDLYDGDICKVEGLGNCVVEICPYYGVQFDNGKGQVSALIDSHVEGDRFEIIGNYYENPELLESK